MLIQMHLVPKNKRWTSNCRFQAKNEAKQNKTHGHDQSSDIHRNKTIVDMRLENHKYSAPGNSNDNSDADIIKNRTPVIPFHTFYVSFHKTQYPVIHNYV